MIGVVLLVALVFTATLTYRRIDDFLNTTTGHGLTLGQVVQAVEPQPGTIAYKLDHGQQVNILLLGMGGYENDAPFLTDSIMAVTIDPNSHRVMLASVPRDLVVHMNLQTSPSSIWTNKINAAYEVPLTSIICCVAAQYQGRDGGGHAAEHEVGKVLGMTFDRYIAVDFVAFRDMVNALGGVDVCLTSNLDDNEYPNYGHGFMPIHFKAGCQHLTGEQALEVARSRHAIEADQSSDFGRARRQQDIMQAIKAKTTTVNGFAKAPALLDALQKNIHTDMSLSDMKAIYDWGKNLPNSSILRLALTAPAPATDGNFLYGGNCGMGNASQLCPEDPSYGMIHKYIASVFIDQSVLAEKAPVQITNGSYTYNDIANRVTTMFDPLGLQLADPVAHAGSAKTVILDYSGGQFPKTAQWLATYFGATVVPATPSSPAPARGQQTYGLVVVIGHDFGVRWYGL
jgi:polyisoprenyl-teichoic acid--peptidoglycan teichoic acid transferase